MGRLWTDSLLTILVTGTCMTLGYACAKDAAAETLLIGDCNTSWPGGYGELYGGDAIGCAGSALFDWWPGADPAQYGCEDTGAVYLYRDLLEPVLADYDRVVIMLGSNDAAFGPNTWVYRIRMAGLAESIQRAGPKVYIATPPRCFPPLRPTYFACTPERAYNVEQYAIAARVLALSYEAGPDVYALLDKREDFIWDGLHLSQLGHAIVAEALPEPAGGSWVALGVLVWIRRAAREATPAEPGAKGEGS